MWQQHEIVLRPRPRGAHLVTDEVLAGLAGIERLRIGLCHLFLRHTSAALALNENASPDVRHDLAAFLDDLAPDGRAWTHADEGPDDMPAHVKSVLVGVSLTVPVRAGRLALGTWQGVWLVEPRDDGGARSILATLHGEGREQPG